MRTRVCTPVDADDRDVLEQHQVQCELEESGVRVGERAERLTAREAERTFSICPAAKPTTSARPFQAMHFSESAAAPRSQAR